MWWCIWRASPLCISRGLRKVSSTVIELGGRCLIHHFQEAGPIELPELEDVDRPIFRSLACATWHRSFDFGVCSDIGAIAQCRYGRVTGIRVKQKVLQRPSHRIPRKRSNHFDPMVLEQIVTVPLLYIPPSIPRVSVSIPRPFWPVRCSQFTRLGCLHAL